MKRVTFTIWIVLSLAILMIVWVTLIRTAKAEFCLPDVDRNIERKAGYRWQWRTVDGRKCWFYSNRLLPREDLIWAFTEYELDNIEGVDRVLGRKVYSVEELR
jgi:hypothetical protein